ncbi:MAG TPA: hypothetical protein VE912_01445, partial [Bacteroidales bacterium]|nr:hypothetical protein [Bacteroidales bacterium]
AVKHGIAHLKNRKGTIYIEIKLFNEILQISVLDNGIGQKQALDFNRHSTKKGREITDKIYSLFDELYQTKFTHQITDMYDETGAPAGVRSLISAPYGRLRKISV